MPTLYVTEPGARVEKEYQRLLVTKQDALLFRVPIQRVSQLVLVGRVGVTTPALHALLQHQIPTLLINRSGRLQGRLLPPTGGNLPLRQAQYRRNDDPTFCLSFTRAVVRGKIKNQRTMALRLCRRHKAIDKSRLIQLKKAIIHTEDATRIDTLRGIEGSAARAYFHIYRQAFAPDWAFNNRNRRPPKDPINALLSLGYSLLTNSMMTALETVGLDPYLGYFHAEKYNRPALALDLIEEFRAPIVDSLVLTLINKGQLQKHHFESGGEKGGVGLNAYGLNLYLREFSKRLESKVKSRRLRRTLSYQKHLEVQARQLNRMIQGEHEPYTPFTSR